VTDHADATDAGKPSTDACERGVGGLLAAKASAHRPNDKGNHFVRSWLPILTWLPEYQRSWLRGDLIAGATIWAVLIPLALAYSALAGVNPVVGLYSIPLALLGYAIFGGSRLLVVGPDAAVAVLSGGIVTAVAVGGSEHLALTVTLALIAGVLYTLFFCLKMGWIADLIPEPVLKGFVEGIVWLTILKQFSALLGLELQGSSQGFFRSLIELMTALPQTEFATAILGFTSVLALILIRKLAPRLPGPIVVLVGSIILVGLLGLDKSGVAVLGEIRGDLPGLGLPTGVNFDQVIALVAGALAIVVLGYTKSLAALQHATEQSHESIDPDRELLAIGVSNIGAGLGGGYAVAGSLTATTVSVDSGGKTQIANLFAGVLCVLTIFFLLPLLANLALCSLAAIIVVALAGLSDIRYFRDLWSVRRYEFMVGVAALLGVLVFGVIPGVMIGVVLSLFKLAHGIHTPVTTVVGRTPSGVFVDIDEHPEAQEIPGMLIWRQYGPLVFLNSRVLSNELRSVAQGRKDLRVIVFDATTSAGIDTSAANALLAARNDLSAKGIDLWVVNPRQKGWKLISAILETANAAIPPVLESLGDAVARFEKVDTTKTGKDG
jgi:SulP family sulfate permease